MPSPEQNYLRERLREAGEVRLEARRHAAEAIRMSRELIPIATSAGLSISEIAELLHLTRQGVHNVLPFTRPGRYQGPPRDRVKPPI